MEKIIIDLTQEQINTIIHDSCVLFCKHCGCGIPRDTCTSLGTCKEHDEYRADIRAHLMKKKKKEYPKTYEECLKVLNIEGGRLCFNNSGITQYERDLYIMMNNLSKLLICRDAYWKIAGEEMGLGKPWEPNDTSGYCTYAILRHTGHIRKSRPYANSELLEFPTEEMRDAFYENFKSEIESCKELL